MNVRNRINSGWQRFNLLLGCHVLIIERHLKGISSYEAACYQLCACNWLPLMVYLIGEGDVSHYSGPLEWKKDVIPIKNIK